MPGSTTLGPGHGMDMIDHPDAQRLTAVMTRLHRLLTVSGPGGLTDAQVAALCGVGKTDREEFTTWLGALNDQLRKATA
ncbi:hypothetical protein [Streptomyces sp. NPDC048338]|uniref:hypothetical protein n=1 Tax=Streptomyces sp. NPDC048338 TaxID=3365536 RepID=UPI00370FBBE8